LFRLDSDDVFREEALDRLPWVQHGFGTRLSTGWPNTTSLATAKQIHSDRVLLVESPGPQDDGDALISNVPGIALAIRTADCLPILVADPRNRAVAAIHAGWRGVVSEIAPKTIEAMRRQFDSKPEDLVIAIGPGIGACCFEVGPEVAARFDLSGRSKIDLVETLCRQLGRNGVATGQISAAKLNRTGEIEKQQAGWWQ
jgi:YfiH family protein